MPVATLCAAASSGSARVPEPAIDSSTHVVSFVTLETRAIKDFEPAAVKTFPHGTKYRPRLWDFRSNPQGTPKCDPNTMSSH